MVRTHHHVLLTALLPTHNADGRIVSCCAVLCAVPQAVFGLERLVDIDHHCHCELSPLLRYAMLCAVCCAPGCVRP
jgi:hypothetical protein